MPLIPRSRSKGTHCASTPALQTALHMGCGRSGPAKPAVPDVTPVRIGPQGSGAGRRVGLQEIRPDLQVPLEPL